QGQAAVDDRAAELAFRGIGGIEMQRVLVHRQQGEPGVVGLADRASRAVLVDLADREILEVPAGSGAPATRRNFLGQSHHLLNPWAGFRCFYSILSNAGRPAELPFDGPVSEAPARRCR